MVSVGGFELQYIFSSKHDLQSQSFPCKHDLQSKQTLRANMTYNPNKRFRATMIYNPNKLFVQTWPSFPTNFSAQTWYIGTPTDT